MVKTRYFAAREIADEDWKSRQPCIPAGAEVEHLGPCRNFYGTFAKVRWSGHLYYVQPKDIWVHDVQIEDCSEPDVEVKARHDRFGELTLLGELVLTNKNAGGLFDSGYWLALDVSGETRVVKPAECSKFYREIRHEETLLSQCMPYYNTRRYFAL